MFCGAVIVTGDGLTNPDTGLKNLCEDHSSRANEAQIPQSRFAREDQSLVTSAGTVHELINTHEPSSVPTDSDPREPHPTVEGLAGQLKLERFFDTYWKLIYGVARRAGLS